MRTTEDDVKDVLSPGGDYKPGKPILPFMVPANSLVDWIQANAVSYGRTALSTAAAKSLETWLAAWAYCCSDQQRSSQTNRASASYRGATKGYGFEMNNYGSAALAMDTTGMLRALNDGKFVGTEWLGKPFVNQLDWATRNL